MSTPTISGANSSGWVLDVTGFDILVTPTNSTSFTFEFEPVDCEDNLATISITNNDSDENPYIIELEGFGTDIAAPVTGTGILTFSSITTTSLSVFWTAANDNCDPGASLIYQCVRSDTNNIGTLTEAQTNGTVVMAWTLGAIGSPDGSLTPGATYWYNTIVRDTSINYAVYSQTSVTMPTK